MKIINPIVFLACLLPVANLASATVSESPCPALLEKLSSKSAMQALGGVVIRLQEYYGDGFGDFMNAHALAKQLKAKFSDLEVSIVIDDKHAYKNIKYRFNNFNPKVAVNKIDGIDVYYSETKQGRDFLNTKQFQIIRVPSGNALNFGNIGKLKYNVYLEEPGAPEGSFKLMWRKYPRNKVIKDKNGNLHLRINPGFSLKSFGVNIPDLTHIEALPKPALLEMLREQTKLNLSKHSDIAHAQWGFAYYHKYNSSRGKEYYRALYESLKKRGAQTPVYIFDFSHVDEITDLKRIITKYLKIHLEYKDLHLGFNHIFPDGTFIPTKYNSQKSPYTVVHVGPTNHQLFLHFMRVAQIPVMVTGTQSLFEAIAMDIPFYYEQLVWKLELQEGLAERAKLSLNKEEAEFVKRLYSGVDSKEEPLKELFDSSEKQAIIKKFILSLKQAPSLSWSLEEVAKVLKP